MSQNLSQTQSQSQQIQTQKYTNSQFDYFKRESQIKTSQRYAYFNQVALPYITFGIPTAFVVGILFSRLNMKNMRYTLLNKFTKMDTTSLMIKNDELREMQLRKLKMKYPDYDHFVPILILPLIGAIAYTSYHIKSTYLNQGRNVRDIERERFNILDKEAYKTFLRD